MDRESLITGAAITAVATVLSHALTMWRDSATHSRTLRRERLNEERQHCREALRAITRLSSAASEYMESDRARLALLASGNESGTVGLKKELRGLEAAWTDALSEVQFHVECINDRQLEAILESLMMATLKQYAVIPAGDNALAMTKAKTDTGFLTHALRHRLRTGQPFKQRTFDTLAKTFKLEEVADSVASAEIESLLSIEAITKK